MPIARIRYHGQTFEVGDDLRWSAMPGAPDGAREFATELTEDFPPRPEGHDAHPGVSQVRAAARGLGLSEGDVEWLPGHPAVPSGPPVYH